MITLVTTFIAKHEPILPYLNPAEIVQLAKDAPPMQVAVLDRGMESGLPSVMLLIDLPNRKRLVVETSARLFCTTARAIMARYPNLFDGE